MTRTVGLMAPVLVAASLLLAAAPAASADGLTVIPYGEDCWATGTDSDRDGLNDHCESQLAYWFSPLLWFDGGESGAARLPHFAVKNHSFSTRTLQILYMATYHDDTGVSTGHDGDPEFQVVEVHYSGGKWYLDWVYMSAHRKHSCDSSAWYSYDQLEYDTAIDSRNAYRGWPTIYVAEDKHATYNSLGTCDDGCWYQDYCSQYSYQYLDPSNGLHTRNVGSTVVQLINRIILNGATEYLLEDREFTGWDNQWYRTNSQGYRRHMNDFGF